MLFETESGDIVDVNKPVVMVRLFSPSPPGTAAMTAVAAGSNNKSSSSSVRAVVRGVNE
jgi:hypothetical protein